MAARGAVVVGAGIGGLAAAIELAARGHAVRVFERAAGPGGKMRTLAPGARPIDAGPTVLTMRPVFEELFGRARTSLDAHLRLSPLAVLARHAWDGPARLDLHADVERSATEIAEHAGAAEARGYRAFAADAARAWRALEHSFLRATRPSPAGLAWRMGLRAPSDLFAISPFARLWSRLGRYFRDPRLRQLFGRYATYVGSSPFQAPATLMLIAHLEREGVWHVQGGMHALAGALETAARALGVDFHYGEGAARILVRDGRAAGILTDRGEAEAAGAVVFNGDGAALAAGLLGEDARHAVPEARGARRSLSAVTWCFEARVEGGPALAHHNVFFSRDSAGEFAELFRDRRIPADPTVYLCAQDRDVPGTDPRGGPERFLALVNAPATGDSNPCTPEELARCERTMRRRLEACGLSLATTSPMATTSPADFARLFPGTGGALYGPVSHGWRSAFRRPAAATRLPGLYLAGGSAHPGAGVPMAALSGRLAGAAAARDLASTRTSLATATPGGTSTR